MEAVSTKGGKAPGTAADTATSGPATAGRERLTAGEPSKSKAAMKKPVRRDDKSGWIAGPSLQGCRRAVFVCFPEQQRALDGVVRVIRWLNTVLADYKPVVYLPPDPPPPGSEPNTGEADGPAVPIALPHEERIAYFRLQAENKGWSNLAALPAPAVFWSEPGGSLGPAGRFRIDWLCNRHEARFVFVAPLDFDWSDEALTAVRAEICERHFAEVAQ